MKRDRPSTIDRLPAEIRDEIKRLRGAGRTFDEIHAKLRELDIEVSRSALGRHLKVFGARMRRSREVAEALAERIDLKNDQLVARANVEMLQSMIMDAGSAEEEGVEVAYSPKDLFFLSKSLESTLASERRAFDLERERQKWQREQDERIERAVTKLAAKRGLSADAIAEMKAAFLGIS